MTAPEHGVVVEIVVGRGQPIERLWIDMVERLRSIDADEDDLVASL